MRKSTIGMVAVVLVVAVMAVGYSASADTIGMSTVLGGSFVAGDGSSSPYLQASVTDGTLSGNSGVYLTMSAPGLGFAGTGAYEHVTDWEFRVSTIPALASISETTSTNFTNFTLPTITTSATNMFNDDPTTDAFNLKFHFSEGGDGHPSDGNGTTGSHTGESGSYTASIEFGNGDSVTYFIKGLSSSSFVVGNPGSNYSAASIDDANPGLWVGGNTITVGDTVPTPLPSSLLGGLLLLGGFGGFRRLRKRGGLSARI